ncbi:unnamed protein product [Moneuplotes crassus]|uniref:Uncharacterized protein n=1 Tax=Euplotes crassus TaxID=5936 RepID=A0AAD1Y7U8_EUPCR|nr:unnamed protein product [Moneuplotes crassus]
MSKSSLNSNNSLFKFQQRKFINSLRSQLKLDKKNGLKESKSRPLIHEEVEMHQISPQNYDHHCSHNVIEPSRRLEINLHKRLQKEIKKPRKKRPASPEMIHKGQLEEIANKWKFIKDRLEKQNKSLIDEKVELEQDLKKAYDTIEWYRKELAKTKNKLKDTLVQLSQAQMISTSATPVSIAKEHNDKISFNSSGLNKCKESVYKFNEASSDFTESENYSICEEKNYEKSSTDTKYNSINFEEMNYNSASNHMRNFNKYSMKKKHIFTTEGSSGGIFTYNMMRDAKYDSIPEPTEEEVSEKTQSLWCEESLSNMTSTKDLAKNASITSLPAKRKSIRDDIPRCSSLVSLLGNQKQPSKKERFVLNQYLYEIKEESDDNFRKFMEKQSIRRTLHQEDVIIEEEEEENTKNVPMSMYSATRYESNHSGDSPIKVNIPHRTRSRNEAIGVGVHPETLDINNNHDFGKMIKQPFSRNNLDRNNNPIFRTFELKNPHQLH